MAGVIAGEGWGRQWLASTLVISPGYPSAEDAYAFAFVHTRIRAYRAAGIDCTVVTTDGTDEVIERSFEGVPVLSMSFQRLGELLRRQHFDTICLHFLNPLNARMLEAADLSGTRVLLWCHGGESLYWERERYTTPYFGEAAPITAEERADYLDRDAILRRFDALPQVTWVFVSEFCRDEARRLTGVGFERSVVIPNYIDGELFRFEEKDPGLAREAFFVRKFTDESCYAIDVAVRAILELSRRPVFAQLHFTICGTGPMHELLLEPVRGLPNVSIEDRFLTHAEIAERHRQAGIALFPTRFDTQGVSMLEAASSGLAVVSTDRASVAAWLPDDLGLLCPQEDYVAYADAIERLVADDELFLRASRACHDKAALLCGRAATIERELALLRETPAYPEPAAPEASAPVLALVLGEDVPALRATSALVKRLGLADVEVVGHASARDALEKVRAPWVRWVAADESLEPEGLCALVEALRARPQAEAVLCAYRSGIPHLPGAELRRALPGAASGLCYELADLSWPGYGLRDGQLDVDALVLSTELARNACAACGGGARPQDLARAAAHQISRVLWIAEPVWCQRALWSPDTQATGPQGACVPAPAAHATPASVLRAGLSRILRILPGGRG